jgi:hypothetical protein
VVAAFDRVHPVLDCVHELGAALKLRLMACSEDVALDEGSKGPSHLKGSLVRCPLHVA